MSSSNQTLSPGTDVGRPAIGSAKTGGIVFATLILFIVAICAALTIDVVRTGYGIKGDEATYVAMGLSLAYDHDLSYQRRDLERFWGLYHSGPEGIFLKRGKDVRVRFRKSWPYIRITRPVDQATDRLYFGKALIYPLAVAPFVRVAGLNGFLVFQVALIFGVCVCGCVFLGARSSPGLALAFTLAFVGASVVPVYGTFFTPEILNFSLVFFAYFLWLYKEVSPSAGKPWLHGTSSDILAAILLGMAAYSKPSNAPLIAPLVLLFWFRRRFWRGMFVGASFAMAAALLFGLTALNSGEFNFQGGDRKTFYSRFPFDAPDSTWEQRGIAMTTNESDAESVLEPAEFVSRFSQNVKYFLVGRHHGFIPYFFPGLVAVVRWLFSRNRWQAWRVLAFSGVAFSALALLVFLPYTWNGGGGPSGNRYFLSLYPVLFFLAPRLTSPGVVVLTWLGGALFTAKLVVNPFVAAKFPYLMTEKGAVRRLPVELTMANDLPIALDISRARIPYGNNPTLLLYFLDQHAFPPEPPGMWVSGAGRADIVVRSENRLERLSFVAQSPIRTVLTASAGGTPVTVPLTPGKVVTFDLPASADRGLRSYAYLLSLRSSEGFIPHLADPGSPDSRNLGVLVRFTGIEGQRSARRAD